MKLVFFQDVKGFCLIFRNEIYLLLREVGGGEYFLKYTTLMQLHVMGH